MIATAPARPALREAHEPPELRGTPRDGVRLLVSDRTSGASSHHIFSDLAALLRPNDLVVVNDSATLPAALDAQVDGGPEIVLHCSSHVAATLWIVEPRAREHGGATPLSESERAPLAGARLHLPCARHATLLAPVDSRSTRLWYARLDLGEDPVEYLHAFGRPIRYRYAGSFPLAAYQTIFARVPGSAEMPSAARPFTPRTVSALATRGVRLAAITLHAGVSSQESHEPPYAERFTVPPSTVDAVARAKAQGGRVIAVGTTVVRALESAVNRRRLVASDGWTERIVSPHDPPAIADGLLTGFHEPQASHLQMLAAFLRTPSLNAAYDAALDEGYRWHEFGDVHLIA
jgi:S-adenosylmethionine:tRNA ribosyltransferase-isomerase